MSAATSTYPEQIRAKPEFLVGELGRHAVSFLLDRVFRCLVWGADSEDPGSLSLKVELDNTLKLERAWGEGQKVFDALGDEWPNVECESLMEDCFLKCLEGIQQKTTGQLEWTSGNPFLTVYLPVAFALSTEAKLSVRQGGYEWSQSYENGVAERRVDRSLTDEKDTWLSLELKLDSKLMEDELQVYPFRIRLREFASLVPGLKLDLKYKSFKPKEFLSERGMTDLLEFFVPEEDRLHEQPFEFRFEEDGLVYHVSAFLLHSAMERFKSFADFDESYHGGLHEQLFRKTVRQVIRRFCKVEIPVKRQSLENVASSRMSYFGQFGSTIPYQSEERKSQFVRTLPGVAAAIRVGSPDLSWETNFRARVTGPKVERAVGQELSMGFRNWLLDHLDTVEVWKKQWEPKKRKKRRKKRKKKAQEPAKPEKIDEVLKDDKKKKK